MSTPRDFPLDAGGQFSRPVDPVWPLDAMSAAVIAADLTAKIFYCNPAAARLYGYSREQLLGARGPDLLVRPADRSRSAELWAMLMAGRPVVHTFPVWCADGSTRTVRATGSPLWNDDQVVGAIGVCVPVEEAQPSSERSRHPAVAAGTAGGCGWHRLTRGELAVARLVARGLTNRGIAERLFLSQHTVDSHLKHAYAKLGIQSRVQLTRELLMHEPDSFD